MARPYTWSAVEDAYLRDHFGRVAQKQLAKDLGRSQANISQRLLLLGLRSTEGPDLVHKVCQNPACGSVFQVTQCESDRDRGQFCTPSCHQSFNCLAVPSRELLKLDYENFSTTELAKKYGVSKGTIYNWFKAYGLTALSPVEGHDRYVLLNGPESKRFKGGFKDDLGVIVRSSWEASVLRWLNYRGISWEFEPTRFSFPEAKGSKSYLPDIWLPEYDGGTWIEVKGRLNSGDQMRIRRFKKHWPEEFEKLAVIPGSKNTPAAKFFEKMEIPVMAYFLDLNKEFKDVIENWNA